MSLADRITTAVDVLTEPDVKVDEKIIFEKDNNKNINIRKRYSKTGYSKTNEHLETDLGYILNATNAIISFIDFIHLRMSEKLGLPPPKLITVSTIVKRKRLINV